MGGHMPHTGADVYGLGPDLTQMLVFSTYLATENGPVCPVVYIILTPFSPWESVGQNISLQNTSNVLLLTLGVYH